MSRNLTRRNCARCDGDVKIVGPIADITRDQARAYLDEYQGMKVADAECVICRARYLAWCVAPPSWPRWEWYTPTEGGFFDLSYRSTFNDEPGPEDLPTRTRRHGHPAPWQWEESGINLDGGGIMIVTDKMVDANGERVMWAPGTIATPHIRVASGYVKAVLAAAGEMVELLMRQRETEAIPEHMVNEYEAASLRLGDDIRALLARIDAASEPRQPR